MNEPTTTNNIMESIGKEQEQVIERPREAENPTTTQLHDPEREQQKEQEKEQQKEQEQESKHVSETPLHLNTQHRQHGPQQPTGKITSDAAVFQGDERFKIFIAGLAPQTTLEGLTSAVKTNFVGVKKVTLYLKKGKSRRFGFISLESEDALHEMLKQDQLWKLDHHKITFRKALSDQEVHEQKETKDKEQRQKDRKRHGRSIRPMNARQRYKLSHPRAPRELRDRMKQEKEQYEASLFHWQQQQQQQQQQQAQYMQPLQYWMDPLQQQQRMDPLQQQQQQQQPNAYGYPQQYSNLPTLQHPPTAAVHYNFGNYQPTQSSGSQHNPYVSAFAYNPWAAWYPPPIQGGATTATSAAQVTKRGVSVNHTPSNTNVPKQKQCPWKSKLDPVSAPSAPVS